MPLKEGKSSNIKKPKICNWPVKIAIPVNNKITPPTFVIFFIWLCNFFEKNKNLSIKIPEITKGSAKPNEYEDSNSILRPIFSSIAAKVKIDPRIGPMHGVHPKPKAAPTMNGKAKLWLYVFVKNLTSLFINLKLIIPIRWREKKIIIKPAKILKLSEFDKKKFPTNEAVDPKAIKTNEKPKVKKIVLMTIKSPFFFSSLLKDVPEI